MKYFSNHLLVYLLPLLVPSCKCNNGQDGGGGCTYDTKIYPATVIKIEKKDSLNADIIFRVEDNAGQLYRDSVSWYMESKRWLLISDIEKDSIVIGKKFTYTIDIIKTGTCNPHMERLVLEKY